MRAWLELCVEAGSFRDRFEAAGEGNLKRPAVMHRPGAWPVIGDGLHLDKRAAFPPRPVPGAEAGRSIGNLLHHRALRVPLQLSAVVGQVVECVLTRALDHDRVSDD